MNVYGTYPENQWVKVGKRASLMMGITEAEFFTGVGTSFVRFVTSYGFDKLTGSIARNYRDFVQVRLSSKICKMITASFKKQRLCSGITTLILILILIR